MLRTKYTYRVLALLVIINGVLVLSASAQNENACLIEQPVPERPKDYGTLDAETSVMFRVEFLSNGTIGKVEIVKSSQIKRLDELARDAVDRVRFKPKHANGSPVTTFQVLYYRYSWRTPGWRVGPNQSLKLCEE